MKNQKCENQPKYDKKLKRPGISRRCRSIRVRSVTVTLLLHTTRMHSQLLARVRGVAASKTNKQTYCHLTTEHHSYAFSTSRECWRCDGFANKQSSQKHCELGQFLGSYVVNRVFTTRLVQWLRWVWTKNLRKERTVLTTWEDEDLQGIAPK